MIVNNHPLKEIIIMTKKKTLVNESVIRRWGKLANMPALTENFLDTAEELEEEERIQNI